MATLEKRALEQALNILKGLDAQFWVRLPSGEEYGERGVMVEPDLEPGRKRKKSRWPPGAMTEHFKPFLCALVPGETAHIPCGDFGNLLQNSVTGWASKYWGAGSYITKYEKETNTLSIMRTM